MIENAIIRAYQLLHDRKWDTVYWAVDLHGVVLKSNYENGDYQFICPEALEALREISHYPETKIIIWSSCHQEEQKLIIDFLTESGIKVAHFNENPEVTNTKTGCFDKKFYFSILLDDKAGFHPHSEWETVREATAYWRKLYVKN